MRRCLDRCESAQANRCRRRPEEGAQRLRNQSGTLELPSPDLSRSGGLNQNLQRKNERTHTSLLSHSRSYTHTLLLVHRQNNTHTHTYGFSTAETCVCVPPTPSHYPTPPQQKHPQFIIVKRIFSLLDFSFYTHSYTHLYTIYTYVINLSLLLPKHKKNIIEMKTE